MLARLAVARRSSGVMRGFAGGAGLDMKGKVKRVAANERNTIY